MKCILPTLLLSLALCAPASAQSGGNDVMVILDASGSMWGLVEGQSKMSIARQSVGAIVGKIRANDRIGLMAYGHRQKGDCNDIEVMIPVARADAARFKSTVDAIVPKGKTPLSGALTQAAQALKHTERKATAILVSDGIETCGADPCAVAAELKKNGVDFVAHVIGFDIADPVAKRQLQCIARNTGGVYLDAKNSGGLDDALNKTIEASQGKKVATQAPAKETEDPLKDKNLRGVARLAANLDPLTDEGLSFALHKPGEGDKPGEWMQTEYGARLAIAAPPGRYVVVVKLGNTERAFPVMVEAGKPTNLDANLNAGMVVSEGSVAGSGAKAADVTWEVFAADGQWLATSYDAVPKFILPAGRYALKLTKGTASVSKPFDLAAGDSINLALTLDAGRITVMAFYAPGGPAVKDELTVEVRQPGQGGKQGEWITTQYGAESTFDLTAGRYDIVAYTGKAVVTQNVDIQPGSAARLALTLNAGVVGIKAASSDFMEVYGAVDINGRRALLDTGYNGAMNVALPVGDYVASADFKGRKVQKPFSVAAGQRIEVTLAP